MGLLDRLAAPFVAGEPLPDDARDELSVALALADRGDLSEAEQRLTALAARHPRAAPVQVVLGEVRARRGDDEGAVAAFGRAVDIDVGAVDAWLGLGEALVRLRRPDPARDAFRRVLQAASDEERRARAHAGRGRLALDSGRTAKAVRELRKAAELRAADPVIAADVGRVLLAAGDPEGWPWLHRAARDSLASGVDVALVIEAARGAPRHDAAEALLREAIEALPGDARAGRARLEAALAERLGAAGRADEARDVAARALAGAPEDELVLDAWRAICEVRGDYGEALRTAARAAELGAPPAPEVLVRLALGAEDRDALARAAAGSLAPAVRAFLDGRAGEDDLLALGVLAPTEAARRFVAAAVAPAPPPSSNLYALLEWTRDLAERTPELQPLRAGAARAVDAFDRPLLIAVMGEFNAGKSSFVNALCGAEVAPVGVTPTTATINVLRHGAPGARVLFHDGRVQELSAEQVARFLGDLGDDAAAVRTVEVFFPLDVLRRVEIVDTPGLNSLRAEHERVARGFLTEADAIVWLFALGQAAKATERDALGLAQGAGKRVLGVLNKADQADAGELERLLAHVRDTLGDRIEGLLAMSAREALRAQRREDATALAASGLPAVMAALEDRFFADARTLKRRTALGHLGRFGVEARAMAAAAPQSTADDWDRRRAALAAAEERVRGALAAERVGLRARLERAFAQAAAEVLEFVRPRRWPFGERRAESADEEFLSDMLEDAVVQATDATRAALEAAAPAHPALPIGAAVERFRAYARGELAGGLLQRFLRDEIPGGERAALERSLARRAPDVDAELIDPLAADIAAAFARARAEIDGDERRAGLRRLLREARLEQPLEALSRAVAALE